MSEILQFGAIGVIAFVFVIGLVIVIHELGHLFAGRMCGVHAEVFSFGFGPTLFAVRDRKGTTWRVAALPLGGYVKFLGDANAASAPDQEALAKLRAEIGPDAERCFHFKPVWQRAFITAAGPIANFILAIVIFIAFAMIVGERGNAPIVANVRADSPAATAGFEPGDHVISVDGRPVRMFSEITNALVFRPGEPVDFVVERDGEQIELTAAAQMVVFEDRYGGERQYPIIGLESVPDMVSFQYTPLEAIGAGTSQVWGIVEGTGQYVWRIVTFRASPEMLSGPAGILTVTSQIANSSLEQGVGKLFADLLRLAGILSIGLGLVNLLPIPILDGGHLVYYAYEAVARRPMSAKMQEIGFRVGLALVLGMMLVATWNDLNYARTVFF